MAGEQPTVRVGRPQDTASNVADAPQHCRIELHHLEGCSLRASSRLRQQRKGPGLIALMIQVILGGAAGIFVACLVVAALKGGGARFLQDLVSGEEVTEKPVDRAKLPPVPMPNPLIRPPKQRQAERAPRQGKGPDPDSALVRADSRPFDPEDGVAGRRESEPSRVNIVLPSGAVLSDAVLELPPNWRRQAFPDDGVEYIERFPNETVSAACSFDDGKIDGTLVQFYENGSIKSLAVYDGSRKSGALRLWTESGQRRLYADFVLDRKDGIQCLFKDGVPWLVCHWDKNELASEVLVRNGEVIDIAKAVASDQSGSVNEEAGIARAVLAELEASIDADERSLKPKVSRWFREEDTLDKQSKRAKKQSVWTPEKLQERRKWRTALPQHGF